MKTRSIAGGILLFCATVFTACKTNDGEIKSNVSDAVKNDDVDVSVKDGVVTLSGEVKDPATKAKAEAEARHVEGVQTVVNEIEVTAPPAPPVPDRASAMSAADEKLYREVQAVLTTFPDVNATVNDGVVTLTGSISKPGLLLLKPKIAGLFPKKAEYNLTIK